MIEIMHKNGAFRERKLPQYKAGVPFRAYCD
jgi:hypothetical protein